MTDMESTDVQNILKGCVSDSVDSVVEAVGDQVGEVAVFASVLDDKGNGTTSYYCHGSGDDDAIADITRTLLHLASMVSGTVSDLASSYLQDGSREVVERTKREFIYSVCAGALGIASEKNVSSDDGKKELMEYLNLDINGESALQEENA